MAPTDDPAAGSLEFMLLAEILGEDMTIMRIGSIKVENFKSLIGFNLRLAKFSCLIGLNGSGKSTVLQFLDFMGRQVRGDVEGWLKQREWKASDVLSKFTSRRNVEFVATILNDTGSLIAIWKAGYNTSHMNCTVESIVMSDVKLIVTGGEYNTSVKDGNSWKDEKRKIEFRYQGSILSQLRDDILPPNLVHIKRFIRNLHSLDMLTPDYLRQRTRQAGGSLGLGGQQLSSFIRELSTRDRAQLIVDLQKAYPRLLRIIPKSLRGGWTQLETIESFESGPMRTESRHLNDGMLRLIAILAELSTEHKVILFDEIENGVNPELVDYLVTRLIKARQQVVVTTHSPLILNYLEDDIAREGVIYLYKTPQGHTQSIPFFTIPSVAEKLAVMGPGEAFVDTSLDKLEKEIASMPQRGQ